MKILLVEEDQEARLAIADALSSHHHSLDLATDGWTGLELAKQSEYELILLDATTPELDGTDLCKQLRAQGCQCPILLMAENASSQQRISGLDAGADDYVTKPIELDELMARVRALLRRGRSIQPVMMQWGMIQLDLNNSQVVCGDRPIHFTPKEYCLLELFLLNPKRIFSRKAILDRLWDFAEPPGEETISTHIKCLRQKLKAAGAADPIETVHGLGYRLRADVPTDAPISAPTAAIASPTQETHRRKVAANTARVWDKFKDKFMLQVAVLEQAAIALQEGSLTPELQHQANYEAHKLAGSLGIFGMMEGSRIARDLEDWFQPQLMLDRSQADLISERITQLQQELRQNPTVKPESEPKSYAPLVLIVDDDLLLAERVRVEAIAWGMRVEVATDLDVARQILAQLRPDVILLDLNFPGNDSGFTLLHELMQRVPHIPVLAFTGRGSLADRLAVARSGGCVFLQKPLPTHKILQSVTDVLSRSQVTYHNRILMVDDDQASVEALTQLLQPLGVDVTGLSNPQQFWEMLTATAPNLLLLDLEMPGFDGVDLCQAVRSDPQWQNLTVLFLSAHTGSDALDRAFAAGADDYLSKSLTEVDLVNRIIYRLRRVGFEGTGLTIDAARKVLETGREA